MMNNDQACLTRAFAVLVMIFLLSATAAAQDSFSFFRGDEVGPSVVELDEETFINILSFDHSLETLQPWLKADSGYRAALGSLSTRDLWLDQEIKHLVRVSDSFAIRVRARQTMDLDTTGLTLQPTLEYKLDDRFEALAPALLDGDKGGMGGGLGIRFRDPEMDIDYLQLAYLRSGILFEHHARAYRKSTILKQADVLEAQGQGKLLGFGLTSFKVANLFPNSFEYAEKDRREDYRGIRAWLLHRQDLDERNRLFFRLDHDQANEEMIPFEITGDPTEVFSGMRSLSSGRVEYHRDLDDEGIRRIRTGVQLLYLSENEYQADDIEEIHSLRRREAHLYGGYRIPLGMDDKVTLETALYLGYQANQNRYPFAPSEERRDPGFQGKVSFFFQWAVKEKVEFVLSPSFELDRPGWGGGVVQCRWAF